MSRIESEKTKARPGGEKMSPRPNITIEGRWMHRILFLWNCQVSARLTCWRSVGGSRPIWEDVRFELNMAAPFLRPVSRLSVRWLQNDQRHRPGPLQANASRPPLRPVRGVS
jgi:hypothetical protein